MQVLAAVGDLSILSSFMQRAGLQGEYAQLTGTLFAVSSSHSRGVRSCHSRGVHDASHSNESGNFGEFYVDGPPLRLFGL